MSVSVSIRCCLCRNILSSGCAIFFWKTKVVFKLFLQDWDSQKHPNEHYSDNKSPPQRNTPVTSPLYSHSYRGIALGRRCVQYLPSIFFECMRILTGNTMHTSSLLPNMYSVFSPYDNSDILIGFNGHPCAGTEYVKMLPFSM